MEAIDDAGPASGRRRPRELARSTSVDGTGDDATLALLFDEAAIAGAGTAGSETSLSDATLTPEGAAQ